jgi:hypothetical protein
MDAAEEVEAVPGVLLCALLSLCPFLKDSEMAHVNMPNIFSYFRQCL